MSRGSEWTGATRRGFLLGCLTGAGALLAAGCGEGGGSPGTTGGGAPAKPASTHLAPPDLPWTDANIPPAYLKLPGPFNATSGTPGAGGPLSEIRWFSDETAAPPPPLPGNRYWAELNRRLGVRINPVWGPADQASFEQKFAAILASGDLPELVLFNGTTGTAAQAQALQQGAFTDLTAHLSGTALNEYPNLALIAPRIWKNSRINGRIYGVPRGRTVPGTALVLRWDWAQKVGVPVSQITTSAAFAQAMTEFASRDPDGDGRADTWGIPDVRFTYSYFAEMFAAPNGWRLNKDGSLTRDIETDEYRQAVAYARDLYQKGGFHPDAATQTQAAHYSLFEGARVGAYLDAIYASGQTRPYLGQLGVHDPVRLLLPPAGPGHKPVTYNAAGYNGIVMIPSKIGRDDAKVRQLLRVVDYLASPFGSAEYIFMQYGIEGVHFTRAANGNPVRNAQGTTDIGDLFRLMTAPIVSYAAASQYFTDAEQEAWTRQLDQAYHAHYAIGIDDPTVGFFSQSALRHNPTLNTMIADSVVGVISGRDPMSSFTNLVRSWRSQGGDQIRKELQDAIQRHKG